MRKAIDLTGQVFGRLTAVRPTDQRFGSSVGWLCRCSCKKQTEIVVSAINLRNGKTRSCGCLVKKKLARTAALKKENTRNCGRVMKLDLSGKKFGRLTAIKPALLIDSGGNTLWYCECDCGEKNVLVRRGNLITGNTRSCGCLKREVGKRKVNDLTGQVFGRLTAIRPTEHRMDGSVGWLCRCSCEAHTEFVVSANSLHSGNTRSCGCLKKETGKKIAIDLTGQVFGRLTAIRPTEQRVRRSVGWLCRCSCEAQTEVVVSAGNLRSGGNRSCGCLKRGRRKTSPEGDAINEKSN